MSYNYDENDIIFQIYDSYCEIKHDWEHELQQVVYELILYNDDENINEIITHYGGTYYICDLYQRKYKKLNIIDKNLSYNQFLAYIGMYHSIYERLSELIVMNFSLTI